MAGTFYWVSTLPQKPASQSSREWFTGLGRPRGVRCAEGKGYVRAGRWGGFLESPEQLPLTGLCVSSRDCQGGPGRLQRLRIARWCPNTHPFPLVGMLPCSGTIRGSPVPKSKALPSCAPHEPPTGLLPLLSCVLGFLPALPHTPSPHRPQAQETFSSFERIQSCLQLPPYGIWDRLPPSQASISPCVSCSEGQKQIWGRGPGLHSGR